MILLDCGLYGETEKKHGKTQTISTILFFIKELEEIEGDIELNALHEIKDFKKKINNMKDTEIIKLQQQLIDVLESQVVDLSMMSKIELGNDVIDEIRRLKNLINEQSR